jgi:hypothetical protein
MDQQNFFDFMNPILDPYRFNWSWFVLLGFVPHRFRGPDASRLLWESIWEFTDPQHREGWTRMPASASECLERWLADMGPEGACGLNVRNYIWLEEQRYDGDRFHVLIDNFNGSENTWEYLWKEISGGWALTRQIDRERGLGGLLGHFVMRAGFPMVVNCGEFSGRYTQEDFRPWRPK